MRRNGRGAPSAVIPALAPERESSTHSGLLLDWLADPVLPLYLWRRKGGAFAAGPGGGATGGGVLVQVNAIHRVLHKNAG